MAHSRRSPSICRKTGKVRYRTELDAKIALSGVRRDDAEKRTYRCEFCKGWHLTSQTKK